MRRVFIFTATITSNTQSLAGANRNVVQAVDFLIALFFGLGSHITLRAEISHITTRISSRSSWRYERSLLAG